MRIKINDADGPCGKYVHFVFETEEELHIALDINQTPPRSMVRPADRTRGIGMQISIPDFNLMVVAPEIVVFVTALLVMVVDLFVAKEQKDRLAWLSLVGVVAAAGLSYYIWDGSAPQLQGMLVADGYALFLNLVILIAAALASVTEEGMSFGDSSVPQTKMPGLVVSTG